MNKISREMVSRFDLKPAYFGYRYLKPETPLNYEHELIEPASVSHASLPCNVPSRDELSRDSGRWGFSLYDVPERIMKETFIAKIRNCTIFANFVDEKGDPWRNECYAIITENNRVLSLRGTGFRNELHRETIKRKENGERLHKAAWILEMWDRNYSHWLQWHLTKIVLLQEYGLEKEIILPRRHKLSSIVDSSVGMLGLKPSQLHTLSSKVLHVDELTVVGMDDYRPSLLIKLRDRLSGKFHKEARRKVFISRAKASFRKLHNEEECWQILKSVGYERVFMEELSFEEQVLLMAETAVIFAQHGTC